MIGSPRPYSEFFTGGKAPDPQTPVAPTLPPIREQHFAMIAQKLDQITRLQARQTAILAEIAVIRDKM